MTSDVSPAPTPETPSAQDPARETVRARALRAQRRRVALEGAGDAVIDAALRGMAERLESARDDRVAAHEKDLAAAIDRDRDRDMSAALQDRLRLSAPDSPRWPRSRAPWPTCRTCRTCRTTPCWRSAPTGSPSWRAAGRSASSAPTSRRGPTSRSTSRPSS